MLQLLPLMDVLCVIPAYNAERTVHHVVSSLLDVWGAGEQARIVVVNDGSTDSTARLAQRAGAYVLSHAQNLGKGAALRTGLEEAARRGAQAVVTLDADGQHFAEDAVRLAQHPASLDTLVLGVRDLAGAGAPSANQFSNGLSNRLLSCFSSVHLKDTQCGLRRYPVQKTLACRARATGFAFETEVVLTAVLERWPLQQLPVQVNYPRGNARQTHFHNLKDPARIVGAALRLLLLHQMRQGTAKAQ